VLIILFLENGCEFFIEKNISEENINEKEKATRKKEKSRTQETEKRIE